MPWALGRAACSLHAAEPNSGLGGFRGFLGKGHYTARIWKDAADADAEPNHLATEVLSVSSTDTLRLRLALDGGFVAQLTPGAWPNAKAQRCNDAKVFRDQ